MSEDIKLLEDDWYGKRIKINELSKEQINRLEKRRMELLMSEAGEEFNSAIEEIFGEKRENPKG